MGAVSQVWGIRDRLLLEQLERLTETLSSEESIELAEVEEQTLRLLAGVVMLLRRHRVNKRGQCKHCGWMRWAWWSWYRRPRCTVYRSIDFAMSQPLHWVWREVFPSTGAGDEFGG